MKVEYRHIQWVKSSNKRLQINLKLTEILTIMKFLIAYRDPERSLTRLVFCILCRHNKQSRVLRLIQKKYQRWTVLKGLPKSIRPALYWNVQLIWSDFYNFQLNHVSVVAESLNLKSNFQLFRCFTTAANKCFYLLHWLLSLLLMRVTLREHHHLTSILVIIG